LGSEKGKCRPRPKADIPPSTGSRRYVQKLIRRNPLKFAKGEFTSKGGGSVFKGGVDRRAKKKDGSMLWCQPIMEVTWSTIEKDH